MIDIEKHPATPVWEFPEYEPGQKVGLFIPCYIDQFYPSIGKATIQLLEELEIPIEFPDLQTCCGQPAFNSGYWHEARKVIDTFCRAFESYDWIVSPSSSCAAMARVFFAQASPDNDRAKQIGTRVLELTEFLVNVLGKTDFGASYPHKVTLHVGCHGRRELGIIDQPLQLLANVKGLEYVELPNWADCCGFGGTFSVKMPGTSLEMGQDKAKNILSTGAHTVVTPDISCMMHVGGIMRLDPTMQDITVMHIAEMLVQR